MIKRFTITGIAAVNQQNILGIDGDMPWGRLKSDLTFFKKMTVSKSLICGGNTFKTLPPKALEGREFFVITNAKDLVVPSNVHIVNNFVCPSFFIEDYVDQITSKEIMVIGGGLIYRMFEKQYDQFYMTNISGPEFDITDKQVTYFDADITTRSSEMKWSTKRIANFHESNNIGDFNIAINLLSASR